MSLSYDQYLADHKLNVKKGLDWLRDNLPEIMGAVKNVDLEWQIGLNHDASKTESDEYAAYDAYFYGGNVSYSVQQEFNKAWLIHIHKNPHHWQYWILVNDEPSEGAILIDMPYNYIIEMICDWWAFSWKSENLKEIFKWYDDHKTHMQLSVRTRAHVESLLYLMETKLDA